MAERGLNIQKVKDRTSLSRTTISNLYNNYGVGVQFDTLVQLCHLLDCQPGDLFTYHDVKAVFDELSRELQSDLHMDKTNEEKNGHEYVSRIHTQVKFQSDISYRGQMEQVIFDTSVSVEINENKEAIHVNGSLVTTPNLEKLNYPYYVTDYILNLFYNYLIDWFSENFQDYIKNINNPVIDISANKDY